MKSEKIRMASAALAFGIGGSAAGGLVGLAMDGFRGVSINEEGNHSTRIAYFKDEIKQKNQDIIEITNTNLQRKAEIGEACLSRVEVYFVGKTLEDTDEDKIIDDLSTLENKACGKDDVEIRSNIRPMIQSDIDMQNVPGLQEDVKDDTEDIKILKAERNDDNNFDGWRYGAVVFGSAAAAISAVMRIKL